MLFSNVIFFALVLSRESFLLQNIPRKALWWAMRILGGWINAVLISFFTK